MTQYYALHKVKLSTTKKILGTISVLLAGAAATDFDHNNYAVRAIGAVFVLGAIAVASYAFCMGNFLRKGVATSAEVDFFVTYSRFSPDGLAGAQALCVILEGIYGSKTRLSRTDEYC